MFWKLSFAILCCTFIGSNFGSTQTVQPNPDWVSVQVIKIKNTNNNGARFILTFRNGAFVQVCSVKFCLSLPNKTKLDVYSQMRPVPRTKDQYTLLFTKLGGLLPSQELNASVTLIGSGKPKVSVLKIETTETALKCPYKLK
uniref:Uncharacterized protein n=1 Tax=Globodera rostochiensis TaxID=31243 RepID=A0A914H5U9_GLORO